MYLEYNFIDDINEITIGNLINWISMERHKWICPELEALWPVSQEEHCLWCLSYLRRLQPRIETEEMEQELLRVTGGTVSRWERKGEE